MRAQLKPKRFKTDFKNDVYNSLRKKNRIISSLQITLIVAVVGYIILMNR